MALPALVFVLGVAHDRATLLVRSPAENARAVYGVNPLAEAIEIADEIARRAGPDDRIAVIGSEPQIYFYAPPRGDELHLHVPADGAAAVRRRHAEGHDRAAREREAALPRAGERRHVVVAAPGLVDGDPRLGGTHRRRGHRQIGLVEIPPDAPSRSVWGDAAGTSAPRTKSYVAVFERRPDASGGRRQALQRQHVAVAAARLDV